MVSLLDLRFVQRSRDLDIYYVRKGSWALPTNQRGRKSGIRLIANFLQIE